MLSRVLSGIGLSKLAIDWTPLDEYEIAPAKHLISGEPLDHISAVMPVREEGYFDLLKEQRQLYGGTEAMIDLGDYLVPPTTERTYRLGAPEDIEMLTDFIRLCANSDERLFGGRFGPLIFSQKWGVLDFSIVGWI